MALAVGFRSMQLRIRGPVSRLSNLECVVLDHGIDNVSSLGVQGMEVLKLEV